MTDTRPAKPPLVLVIRDGWGENPNPAHDRFNAVKLAKTPVARRLMARWPTTLIRTCGEDVGLPAATMGNSEVGHQNIGAGRVVDQEVKRISRAVGDGSFLANGALKGAFDHALAAGGAVHLLGLVSDGLVHSDLGHLFALLDMAASLSFPVQRLVVHAITDGRDTAPKAGLGFLNELEGRIAKCGVGRVASVMGRYWAMDRDRRWDRVALAYGCLTGRSVGAAPTPETEGLNVRTAPSTQRAVEAYYEHPTDPSREGDEFIVPTRVEPTTGNDCKGIIESGDAVIFFNYRGDRPRQLTMAFVLADQQWSRAAGGGFDRGRPLENLYFCTMTGYQEGLPVSAIAFGKPAPLPGMLGEVISVAGLRQFRCAESEKYPHVTFFFNDYREEPFGGEERLLIPSPQEVGTYDRKPQMSAAEVCDAVVGRLGARDPEALMVVNLANPDMVGHTGNLEAATQAVAVVDECVGRIMDATLARGGSLIVTADHGNAEQMWDPEHDCPHTTHTTYDVALIVAGEALRGRRLRSGGRLADIAPTILAMMGLKQPAAMTGASLLGDQQA